MGFLGSEEPYLPTHVTKYCTNVFWQNKKPIVDPRSFEISTIPKRSRFEVSDSEYIFLALYPLLGKI